MSQELVKTKILGGLDRLSTARKVEAKAKLVGLLEQMLTAKNRQTAYNTKKEVQEAAANTVDFVRNLDRDLLLILMSLESQYFLKQVAMDALLRHPRGNTDAVSYVQENELILAWLRSMPVTSVLRFFVSFTGAGKPNPRVYRLNTSRLKKLFLRYFFERSDDITLLWAVKYRSKLKVIFKHVLGKNKTSALYNILQTSYEEYYKSTQVSKTIKLTDGVLKYSSNVEVAYESLAFILDVPRTTFSNNCVPLNAFYSARLHASYLKELPFEVSWGIAQTYHPTMKESDVLRLTQRTMSEKEKVKRSTTKSGKTARIVGDSNALTARELYVKAYSDSGLDSSDVLALDNKAKQHAKNSQFSLGTKVGILLDTSLSMVGKDGALYHALADALVIKNMLLKQAQAKNIEVQMATTSNPHRTTPVAIDHLPIAVGDTSMSTALLTLLEEGCDSIYVITDGYENGEGSMFGEVVATAKNMVDFSVTQLTVSVAAEVGGVRQLSSNIPNIAVQDPSRILTQILLETMKADLKAGVSLLIEKYGTNLLTTNR